MRVKENILCIIFSELITILCTLAIVFVWLFNTSGITYNILTTFFLGIFIIYFIIGICFCIKDILDEFNFYKRNK